MISIVIALACSAVLALAVLTFPEGGPEAPADRGGCDPFCADPVAGLDAALTVAALGLVLALLGLSLVSLVARTARSERA